MLRQTAPTFPKNLTDFIVDSSRAQASRKQCARWDSRGLVGPRGI